MSSYKSLRIVFAGTPEFAATHLKALIDDGCNVIAAYTQPDRPSGRGKKLTPSAVKRLAIEADIPVYQPISLKNSEAQSELASLDCDLMVVVAYGLLLPKEVLDQPKHGCINVHGSLLPKWRGAAPIQRAVEAGDAESGVVIMQMDEGLDTGDMLVESRCKIAADESSASLHDKLAAIGPPALIEAIAQIANGESNAIQQDHDQSTYAAKILKSEAKIDWNESATMIDRKVRAFNPFPIAYSEISSTRLKIHAASVFKQDGSKKHGLKAPGQFAIADGALIVLCGDESVLKLEIVQAPGKKPSAVNDFINGSSKLLQPLCFDTDTPE